MKYKPNMVKRVQIKYKFSLTVTTAAENASCMNNIVTNLFVA